MHRRVWVSVNEMRQPRLKTCKDGHRTLYVYFDKSLANFDQAIVDAERHFGLVGASTVTVIALPYANEVCQPNVNQCVKNDQ